MQERDLKILDFITKVRVCTREQIQEIYFPQIHQNVPMRRLKYLVDNDYLKRSYFNINDNKNVYVYYIDKKPSKRLLKHDLLITDFATKLILEGYEIIDFKKSIVVGDVIPDAYLQIRKNGKTKSLLLEMQLSGHDCIKKYYNFKETVLEHTEWPVMPRLFVITNNQDIITDLQDISVITDNLDMYKVGDLL